MVVVVDEFRPLIARDPDGEIVGIEGWAAYQGQNFSVAGIHGDDGPVAPVERLFGGDLEIEIDGEFEGMAGLRGSVVEGLHFLAVTVDYRTARSVLAH